MDGRKARSPSQFTMSPQPLAVALTSFRRPRTSNLPATGGTTEKVFRSGEFVFPSNSVYKNVANGPVELPLASIGLYWNSNSMMFST